MQIITIFIAVAITLSLSHAEAADSYVGKMTGIDCTACKTSIAKAMVKIRGVKTIRIKKLTDSAHQITVETDGAINISKAQATKALGKDSHYKIISWSKSG